MAKGKKTGGRQKGTPNKVTTEVKSLLKRAFEEVGGLEALTEWAKLNQTEFYRLWAKLLPQEIKAEHRGDPANPIQHEHSGTVTLAAKLAVFRQRYAGEDAAGAAGVDGGGEPAHPAPAQPAADPVPRA